ncbi:MAG TPA: hypothetical protein EYQ81_09740 [Sneathiellales bacterium]|nr:hypothetical protein [Sneathiellales bacterium]
MSRKYVFDPSLIGDTDTADLETAPEEEEPEAEQIVEDEPLAEPVREKIKVPPGVVIAPLQGAPITKARGLSADIARTLTRRNVRASSRSTAKIAYLLEGRAHLTPTQEGTTDFRIDWNLLAPDGLSVGRFSDRVPVSGSDWRAVSSGVLRPMADRAAAQVDILMQEHARIPTAVPIPSVEIAELAETLREVSVVSLLNPVVVEYIDGAPGDGRLSLQDALINALLKARVPVSRMLNDKTFVIVGDVHSTPISNDSDAYQFTWMIMRADGTLVGTASHEMNINRKRIVPQWGTVADVAIESVIGDIVAIIDKAGTAKTDTSGKNS